MSHDMDVFVMKLNAGIAGWSRSYQAALRRYLAQGPAAGLSPALRLGRQAVALGLETLDLARFHEHALASLNSPDGPPMTLKRMADRAKLFFAEAIVPIEKTHGAALMTDVRVGQVTQALRRRTAEMSSSTRHLARSVTRREAAETALRKRGDDRARLLLESSGLQTRLLGQTREMLTSQEDERQKNSRHLQDEIAQTLLAINLRLLSLKTSAKASTDQFEKEIAHTQRLVRESVKRINRFAHEFALRQKT